MRRPRFRLRSLMILVLIAALGLAAAAQVARMEPVDFDEIRERLALVGAFLILVLLKLGSVFAIRARRGDPRRPGPDPRP